MRGLSVPRHLCAGTPLSHHVGHKRLISIMVWMGGDSSSSSNSPRTTSPPSQPEDSPQSTTQRKKKITRTRTGCQTCRDRKVKCGEERPHCLNCQRTNHVCPGYAPATIFKAPRRGSGGRKDSPTATEADDGTSRSPLCW